MYRFTGDGVPIGAANYTLVAKLDLPAGAFLITGVGHALNQTEHSLHVYCHMYGGSSTYLDGASASLPAPRIIDTDSLEAFPFLATVDQSTAGQVRVECISGSNIERPWPLVSVKLVAQEVGKVVVQSP